VTLFPEGRPRTSGALVLRGTTVSLPWAALMVTVSEPEAPWVTCRVAGRRLLSVGPAGRTVIVLWRLLPLRDAVIVAVPGARAVIVIMPVSMPEGTVTVAGTDATVGSLLVSVMGVALDCGALMVAVRVPLPPWLRERLAGSSPVRVGPGHRFELADAVEVRVRPSGPLRVQTRLLPLKGTRKAPWS
jgi:hypothetical protein